MSIQRTGLTTLGVLSLAAATAVTGLAANAADHLDAPAVRADGRTDINDVYVFQSPQDADKTVLIMTVNPAAGMISGTSFHPDAKYRFNIDDNGDAKADRTIDVRFDDVGKNGKQEFSVRGSGNVRGDGLVGKQAKLRNGGKATAGVFDDPFFFDLAGFRNGFAFTGVDFFKGFNTSAIVLEVPSKQLGTGGIGVWATTIVDGKVVDQMARPAINTALISAANKDAFNTTPPSKQWERFGAEATATITALSGDAAYADAVARILIPDVLTFTLGDNSGFLNGRQLANDVIDVELSVLTNGGLGTDGVNSNDSTFSNMFPYLAPAH